MSRSLAMSTSQVRPSTSTWTMFLMAMLIAGGASAGVPECAHWTNSFVFTEFMPHAEVTGTPGQRLRLFRQNPQICSQEQTTPCETKRYLIPGDRVVIGHECSSWAHIQYRSRRSTSTGWVERARLRNLSPDQATLAAQAKRRQRPIEDPLERAVATGDINAVRPLLNSKAEMSRALAFAVARRQSNIAMDLLQNGLIPSEVSDPCQIVVNAVHGDLKVLSALLDASFPINCTSGRQKVSPLKEYAMANRAARPVWAAMGNSRDPGVEEPVAIMQLFLRHRADLNIKDVWGGTPLRATVEKNNVDIAKLLLEAGADVNNYIDDSTSIGEQSGNTVLMAAVAWYGYRWDPTLVRLLLRHGADVNFRNELRYDAECDRTTSGKCTFRGQTALTRAATEGFYGLAKLLLDGGANPTLARGDGATPAEIARANGHPQVADLIEKYIKK